MALWAGLLLACATQIHAQTPTISMFLNMEHDLPTPIISASIVDANPTATTFVANCNYSDDSMMCQMTDQTITSAPSWQILTSSGPDGSYSLSCTFTGTTDGLCDFLQSPEGGPVNSGSLTYDANFPFPGFIPVLVTAGAEELEGASEPTDTPSGSASATSTSDEAEETAGTSEPRQTVSVTVTASGSSSTETNGVGKSLPCALGYLAGPLVAGLSVLYL